PRINSTTKLSASNVTLLARRFETDIGIHTERKPPFLTGKPIFPAPPLSTGRANLHIKASVIPNFERSFLRIQGSNFYVGKRHNGGNSLSDLSVAPKVAPHNLVASVGRHWIVPDNIHH